MFSIQDRCLFMFNDRVFMAGILLCLLSCFLCVFADSNYDSFAYTAIISHKKKVNII